MGAGLRPGAKATDKPPDPKAGAPVLDSTPIQPAFRDKVPYMILLVDLDTQKGKPSEHEALRVAGNLVTADGEFAPPEAIRSVGIGTRVRMVFSKVADGFSLPQWTIDEDADQPEAPWRYPQE